MYPNSISVNKNNMNHTAHPEVYLTELAVPDPDERRNSLRNLLSNNGLEYTVQKLEPSQQVPQGVENYLVKTGSAIDPHLLFCAHYDAVPGSYGANDNAAAVCILIELAKAFKSSELSAEFAFFDGEESKHAGSKLFVNEFDTKNISAVINLDICGYGDTITVYSHGSSRKKPIRNFCDKAVLARHNGKLVKYLPESDDISFNGTHLPVLSIAIMPKWDVQFLKTLAAYNDSILGKPPEFELILGQMEVITTMHGGFRDKISSVQPEAMQQLYHFLMDAATSPLPPKKLFPFS